MTNETSRLDQEFGNVPLVFPVTYSPPAYNYGTVNGQQFELMVEGKRAPYPEIFPPFNQEGVAH